MGLPLAPVFALGFGLGSVTGCKAKESEPVAVARAFAETARRGDVEGMLALIEAAGARAARGHGRDRQRSGRRSASIEPNEMLQIVGVDRTIAVAGATLIDETDQLAHVELTMTDGRNLRLELVWEPATVADAAAGREARASGWKVRIPLPSAGSLEPGLVAPQPDA